MAKKKVTPLDLVKPTTEWADASVQESRMATCNGCERLKFKVCRECGCFMPAKTRLADAVCPIGKW